MNPLSVSIDPGCWNILSIVTFCSIPTSISTIGSSISIGFSTTISDCSGNFGIVLSLNVGCSDFFSFFPSRFLRAFKIDSLKVSLFKSYIGIIRKE